MKKHLNQFKTLRQLLAVGLVGLCMLSSVSLSAANDLRTLADAILAQTQETDTRSELRRKSQKLKRDRKQDRSTRNSGVQNNLIDTSRSRNRSNNESQERLEIRVSLDQAVSMVRRSSGGRVIKASTSYRNGRPVHSIRVLTDNNKVRTYRIDAVSGRNL